MSTPRVIGIDLGTSNTCAAYADGRIPRVIPTERGHTLLPSVVAFTPPKDIATRAHFLVGNPAKEQMLLNPALTVYGSKRFVGMPYGSKIVQQLKDRFAYSIVPSQKGMAAFEIEGRTRPLTDVSAILLEQIARYAEAHLGGPLDGAVITVPANYSFTQREAVRSAAQQAGLDVWRLVNEPTAASLAYGVGRHVEQKVLVFDLGGGTFDVSILEIDGGTYQVLSTTGDGFLGGLDFDLRVVDHFLQEFEKNEGIHLTDRTVLQRIIGAAESTKCDLSLLRNVAVRVPFVAQRRGKPVDLELQLTRDTLNSLTEDLMARCFSLVRVALKEAGLGVGDIDEVLLVGGQTRMPEIQNRLAQFFGKAPRKGLHPDEVVAQGAAQLARTLGGQDVRLLDVLSVPVGVMENDGGVERYQIALKRNEGLPAETTVTRQSQGDECVLDVFQGFGKGAIKALANVEYLGSVKVGGLQAGDALEFLLALDVDGILTCTVSINGEAAQKQKLEMLTPTYLPKIEPLPKVPLPNKSMTTKSGMFKRLFSKE